MTSYRSINVIKGFKRLFYRMVKLNPFSGAVGVEIKIFKELIVYYIRVNFREDHGCEGEALLYVSRCCMWVSVLCG